MRLFIVLLLLPSFALLAQVLPGVPVAGIPSGTTALINAIPTPVEGLMAYSTDDNTIYYYNGTAWVTFDDNQNANEVPLVTNVDVNYDTTTGTGTTPTTPAIANETTVEEVVQAIAPITSKAGRVFFPPSIAIDASTNGTGRTLNLYNEYLLQYSLTPAQVGGLTPRTAASNGAPGTIPVYTADELYYYVTYADPTIFNNILISNTGLMTYDIIGQPTNDNTLINVVFVIK